MLLATKDGRELSLESFSSPVTISFKLSKASDPDLTGVFYIADDGTLAYSSLQTMKSVEFE